ncbi:hypothetical protein U9M48_021154 [Paspalum notatum var. saurae]|uniref:NAD-dependent epimerase/dehydratase domain-containing protein n=1 Tax=Paspalum notatum var. saurae TaxID=547442 RepID=A0AAQ3TH09_PASNO
MRRVVVTSSAIVPSPGWPAGEVPDERCWTDIDYCEKNGVWYPASKTLAEKAAWKFAEEKGLDVVVVNPGTVLGPMIPPTINASMAIFRRLLQGCTEEYAYFFMGPVRVEDVASAHILVFENPSASGRHICVESISHWSDFAAKIAELYPSYKVPSFPKDTQPALVRSGGRVQEAHRAGAAGHPRGEDHQGRRGEPREAEGSSSPDRSINVGPVMSSSWSGCLLPAGLVEIRCD